MVSVGKLKAGQARYYLDQAEPHTSAAAAVASGAEDYYVGGTEAAGEWCGRGATALNLQSTVGADTFERLLAGRHPHVDMELRTRGSVTAFDVTFSAPKSVSLMFALCTPEVTDAVRDAHALAVAEAFTYFEEAVAIARRGPGGRRRIPGHGLAAAAFLHRTSRAGDPQLHTHVVVANLVQGSDGRWSALDGRLVYAHARTTGFLYQAALRAELTRRIGVRWREVHNGMAETEGIPERVLRAFSRRRAEIEEAMRLHGSAGRDAAQVAALATRRVKDRELRPELLAPEWRQRAAGLGFDVGRFEKLCRRARVSAPVDWGAAVARMAGRDGLTRDQSAFGAREVLQALASEARAGVGVSTLRAVARSFISSDHAVPLLGTRDRDVEPQFSTPELLTLEERVLETARSWLSTGRGMAQLTAVEGALASRPYLSQEQCTMVTRLTRDGDGVAAVIGRAGTGKTTALAAAREAWERSGVPVQGCALARRAARELERKAGLPATSVAAMLRRRRPLDPGTILIVDEAGMLGTRDLAGLLDMVARADGKLILAGDPAQLPSIQAGGALDAVSRRLDPIILRENRRQRHAWEREAVEAIRAADSKRAMALYDGRGRLYVGDDEDETFERLLVDWHALDDPDAAVMIAHTRSDVAELNTRAQAIRRHERRLGIDELVVAGCRIATGDRVLVKRNDTRCDVRNGDRGVVERVDAGAGSLAVKIDGRSVVLDSDFLRTPRPGRPSIELGYAITAYAAQGMTCDRALVLVRDHAYREWAYTTLTRATEGSRIYVVPEPTARDEFAPSEDRRNGRELLRAALERSNASELAVTRTGRSIDLNDSRGRASGD